MRVLDEPVCGLFTTDGNDIKVMLKQLVLVCSLCTLVACVGTSEPTDSAETGATDSRRDCIPEPSIRGYTVLDEQNLIVDSSGRRRYHVVLRRRAYGLQNSLGVVFDSPTSRICSGLSDVVFSNSFGGRTETVGILDVRLLGPDEEEDLLIKFGKKEPEIRQTPVPREVEGAEVEELDPAARE
jgi:hypothetical protein